MEVVKKPEVYVRAVFDADVVAALAGQAVAEIINQCSGKDGGVADGDGAAGIANDVVRRISGELRGLRELIGLIVATGKEAVRARAGDVVIKAHDGGVQPLGIRRGKCEAGNIEAVG